MSKPEPKNKKLYEKVKREIYKKHPQHSAYRSEFGGVGCTVISVDWMP